MKTEKTITGDVDPDVLDYTVGDDPVLDMDLVTWDCLGTAAHVTMLSEMPVTPPVVTKAEAVRVRAALAQVVAAAQAGDFTIEESDQDVHMAVERRLTETLDAGRSRQEDSHGPEPQRPGGGGRASAHQGPAARP